jgi:glycerol-3-phosphate dehydrogenase
VGTRSTTGGRPLPGAVGLGEEAAFLSLVKSLGTGGLDRTAASHLASTYGCRAPAVLAREGAQGRLDPELPYTWAQVDEAVEAELARTLDDVLARRVPLLLRGRDQGLSVAPAVAERMGRRLGWTPAQAAAQLAAYQATVAVSRAFRG